MGIIIDAALSSEASLIQELLPDLDHKTRNPSLRGQIVPEVYTGPN